jgi:hypothetical protein
MSAAMTSARFWMVTSTTTFISTIRRLPLEFERRSLPADSAASRLNLHHDGQGDYEDPDRSKQLSGILSQKEFPTRWICGGADVNHDWPWWRKMLPTCFGQDVRLEE